MRIRPADIAVLVLLIIAIVALRVSAARDGVMVGAGPGVRTVTPAQVNHGHP